MPSTKLFLNNPSIVNLACTLSKENHQKLVNVARTALVNRLDQKEHNQYLTALASSTNNSLDVITDLFGLYITILQAYVENDIKKCNKMLLDVGFTPDFISQLSHFEKVSIKSATPILKLNSLDWRLDLSISSSTLSKKLSPSIIICLNLNDGKKYVIDVDFHTFHKLRYNIALILKEVNRFESSINK